MRAIRATPVKIKKLVACKGLLISAFSFFIAFLFSLSLSDCDKLIGNMSFKRDKSKVEFTEQFRVMPLKGSNRVLGILEVSSGGVSGTVADPKIIFAAALKGNASGIILAHNHPSGNLASSTAGLDLTKKIREAGKFLEIQLLDHLILTTEGYCSMTDEDAFSIPFT